jgi:hypothetical protein
MVTRTWFISEYMSDCPLGWQQFIEDLKTRVSLDLRVGFSIDTLNRELEPYQARYYESGCNSFVDFADEKCYTLFVLKYGGK